MAGNWQARMDEMKKCRLAAGLPVQIGRGEHQRVNPTMPVFDYEKDLPNTRLTGYRLNRVTCTG